MRRILLIISLCCTLTIGAQKNKNPKPFIVPELKEWTGKDGFLMLSEQSTIVYPKGDTMLKKMANGLADDFRQLLGLTLNTRDGKPEKGDIVLQINSDKKLGEEGYTLQVDDRIVIAAPQNAGVFWGTRTLLQMSEHSLALPKGSVRDWPDYAIRGMMLDCGRKFIPMHFLRDYVKLLAYYKMNAFQIHLNDNGFPRFFENNWDKTYAAFRLECETFPGLTARDGHYTKLEFIKLQSLAEDNYVEIIPEIDAPAHVLAFTQYKPEIGSKDYGMDHLDLYNPATYEFMDKLLKEYISGYRQVFRGKRIHIGTDEYSNRDSAVVEKFRAFTDRYIKYVESFGKQACVWGALTHAKGKTPVKSENVVMSAWYNGYADPKEMVKQGYHLISIPDGLLYIVPQAGYYYDYLNTKYLYEKWTPNIVGKEVFPERDPAILGGMFAVWNDHVGNGITTKDIHHRCLPAIQTLAVKMWTGSHPTLNFDEFDKQRKNLSEAPGVNQAGRLRKEPGLAFQMANVAPNSTTEYEEIGYNYRVSFTLEGKAEETGTVLFESRDAKFYLSDPIKGMLGFSRDGYLNQFSYPVPQGRTVNIAIEGDNRATRLFIDGKKVEELNIQQRYFDEKGSKINYNRTLVFPLRKAGNFKSKITNLRVEQI